MHLQQCALEKADVRTEGANADETVETGGSKKSVMYDYSNKSFIYSYFWVTLTARISQCVTRNANGVMFQVIWNYLKKHYQH